MHRFSHCSDSISYNRMSLIIVQTYLRNRFFFLRCNKVLMEKIRLFFFICSWKLLGIQLFGWNWEDQSSSKEERFCGSVWWNLRCNSLTDSSLVEGIQTSRRVVVEGCRTCWFSKREAPVYWTWCKLQPESSAES